MLTTDFQFSFLFLNLFIIISDFSTGTVTKEKSSITLTSSIYLQLTQVSLYINSTKDLGQCHFNLPKAKNNLVDQAFQVPNLFHVSMIGL